MSTPPLLLPHSLPSLTTKRLFLTHHHHHHKPLPFLPHRRHASTSPPTHYALFPRTLPLGPPPTGPFALDPRALRAEYLSLQRLYHPDTQHRLSTASENETSPDPHPNNLSQKSQILGTSAHINSAYTTLLSPLLRAQYILSLRSLPIAEDAKTDDASLLSTVLELREEIESAEGEEEIRGLERENERRIERCEGVLGEMFARDDLEGARGEVVRLRYWVNVREALGKWEKGAEVVLGH
ncbi:hypothetical protein BDR22DRAFT_823567 [Usnea florida]